MITQGVVLSPFRSLASAAESYCWGQTGDQQCNEGQSQNEANQRAKQKRRASRLNHPPRRAGFQWTLL